jgi:pSer/pThr/pTyr-binding forkhead associated (FHA) protein
VKSRLLLRERAGLVRDPDNPWFCEIQPGAAVVLGRSRTADIRLVDVQVMREHARIWEEDGEWHAMSLHATASFYLNGVRVREWTAQALRAGDVLIIGFTHLDVELMSLE